MSSNEKNFWAYYFFRNWSDNDDAYVNIESGSASICRNAIERATDTDDDYVVGTNAIDAAHGSNDTGIRNNATKTL